MFRVVAGNKLEELAQRFAKDLRSDPPAVFEPMPVVVQSRGMARWLSLQLTEYNDVMAHFDFPLPARFIFNFMRKYGLSNQMGLDRETLRWRCYAELPAVAGQFDRLSCYLHDAQSDMRLWQLASRVGDLFDSYMMYRPEWLELWGRGLRVHELGDHPDAEWQAELWRKISHEGERTFAQAIQSFHELGTLPEGAPKKVCLFGMTNLPRLFLDFYIKLGRLCDVTVYYLSPCVNYWAELESTKRQSQLLFSSSEDGGDYWEVQQPLLASLGMLGRDFLRDLLDTNVAMENAFSAPEGGRVIQQLQMEMLTMTEVDDEPLTRDRSFCCQSFYSPMREVQGLRDYLLHVFKEQPEIKPRDILVLAPDLKDYGPCIHAVFGSDKLLPYSVADRPQRHEEQISDLFCRFLNLVGGRRSLLDIIAFLEAPLVARRFGIRREDLSRLSDLLREAGIAWGRDAEFRANHVGVAFEENSWRFGLDRLLIGLALFEEDGSVQGKIPLGIEGSDALLLSNVLEFTDCLFELLDSLEAYGDAPQSVEIWEEHLRHALDHLFVQDYTTAEGRSETGQSLYALLQAKSIIGAAATIDFATVRLLLTQALESEESGRGFLQGCITFCKLLPMRSIPAKVVCLLGMNEGTLPRQVQPCGFDLMASFPKTGDRSIRRDDRYLFLETLLSVRDRLYISYIGRDMRSNEEQGPSILISELLNYLTMRSRESDAGERITCCEHPLHGYDAVYFQTDTAVPQSFSARALDAAVERLKVGQGGQHLPDMPAIEGEAEIDLNQLVRALRNPAAVFLKQHLGVNLLLEDEDPLPASEVLRIAGGLTRYELGTELLEWHLNGVDQSEAEGRLNGIGDMPLSPEGRSDFDALWEDVMLMGEAIAPLRQGAVVQHDLQFKSGAVTLNAALQGYEQHELVYSFSKYKLGACLLPWLTHLLQCANGVERNTEFRCRGQQANQVADKTWEPIGSGEAAGLLSDYLSVYEELWQHPLPLFKESSPAFADTASRNMGLDEKKQKDPFSEAEKSWSGHYGDAEQPETRICFGSSFDDLMSEQQADFEALAIRIYGPLLDYAVSIES